MYRNSLPSKGGLWLFLGILGMGTLLWPQIDHSNLYAQSPTPSSFGSVADLNSDATALQALRNMIEKSGGEAVWANTRSMKETFSVPTENTAQTKEYLFLDDWSQDLTRYRRAIRASDKMPPDHNGQKNYSVTLPNGTTATLPELDQVQALVSRVPAAAAETVLRQNAFTVKLSSGLPCDSIYVCVDIYHRAQSNNPGGPEIRLTILKSTGLPSSVRVRVSVVGSPVLSVWKEVKYLSYTNHDDLVVPDVLEVGAGRQTQTWHLVALHKNPGFDPAGFDREAAQ